MVNEFAPKIKSVLNNLIVSDCTFVRGEACDGNAIMDIDRDQDECIDR